MLAGPVPAADPPGCTAEPEEAVTGNDIGRPATTGGLSASKQTPRPRNLSTVAVPAAAADDGDAVTPRDLTKSMRP